MYFNPMYFVFMVPAVLLALWAQQKVKGNYARYSKVRASSGLTGAEVARQMLDANGLQDVQVEAVRGELTDHYDPRTRVLRLSQGVYDVPSIAAAGIAAHETGHAIQHAHGYAPLQWRSAIVPFVSLSSNIAWIVFFAGLMMQIVPLTWAGVALFSATTIFALVTLPVEFDASRRAKDALVQLGMIDGGVSRGQESKAVAAVLDSAAWTYIAAAIGSILNLLYYISLATGASRRN